MPKADRPISLRGKGPWQGVGSGSVFEPTDGLFETLRNVYINRDGTELVRMMGCSITARPTYTDRQETQTGKGTTSDTDSGGFDVTAVTAASPAALTLSVDHYQPTVNFLVRAEGMTEIADGYYFGTRTGTNTITLNVASGGTTADGRVYLERLDTSGFVLNESHPQALAWVSDSPCVVTPSLTGSTDGATEYLGISTWVGNSPLEWDSYSGSSAPEENYKLWPSPVHQEALFLDTSEWPTTAPSLLTFPIRQKPMVDVTNDALLIAVPGYGSILRCNIGSKKQQRINRSGFQDYCGVPQGQLAAAGASSATAGSLVAGSVYWIAIGYRDIYTGQLGLPSDPEQVTVAGGQSAVSCSCVRPRGVVAEGGDYKLVKYISAAGASSPDSMFITEEVGDTNAVGTVTVTWTTATVQEDRLPVLEVPPIGGSWIKTVRGLTFAGGAIADVTNTLNEEIATVPVNVNAIGDTVFVMDTTLPLPIDGRMFHLNNLSNSYAGLECMLGDGETTQRTRLDGLDSEGSGFARQRWRILTQATESGDQRLHIFMPRGDFWYTELGKPGVAPSINRIIVDRIRGRDIRAAGRLGDFMLLMTEYETYRFAWGRSPLGQDPVLISDTYGCAAPSSVVQGTDAQGNAFVAWLSKLGPVRSYGGDVDWVGEPLKEFWDTLKRDSRGLMLHGIGVIDPRRRLIKFGVRSDWFSTQYGTGVFTTDDKKARIQCDEFILWNYGTNSLSTARYAGETGTSAINRMPHADGIDRTAFVSSLKTVDNSTVAEGIAGTAMVHFHDIYSMRDAFADHLETPKEATANEFNTNGFFTADTINSFTNVRSGMQAFIRTGDDTLEWYGTTGAVSTVNVTDDTIVINTPGSSVWADGAVLVLNVIHMEMKTRRLHLGEFGQDHMINAITLQHEETAGLGVSTPHSWADVKVIEDDATETSMQAEAYGQKLGTRLTRFDLADCRSNYHVIDITVISDSSIAIKDISLEHGVA